MILQTTMKHVCALACLGSVILLSGCSGNSGQKEAVLFPDMTLENKVSKKISFQELFPNYSITPLETTDESLIGGRSNKTIKRDSCFYVRSVNDVMIFNLEGKFINKLSRVGSGPGEYESLLDFDVVSEKGEIWVSAAKGIYRYDSRTLDFIDIIHLPFFASEFKYLTNGTIIIRTNEDEYLKICNTEGEELQSFFKADMANSVSYPVSFISIDDKVVWQLNRSNDVVCYDPDDAEFSYATLIPDKKSVATSQDNREYMEKYGYFDADEMIDRDFITVGPFRKIKDCGLMVARYPDDKWFLSVSKGNTSIEYQFFPEDESKLDLGAIHPENPRFINTLINGESPDSFIFLFQPKDDENSNPCILQVFPEGM